MHLPVMYLCIVEIIVRGIAVSELMACQSCAVEALLDIARASVVHVDAHPDAYLPVAQTLIYHLHISGYRILQLLVVRQIDAEAVASRPARQTACALHHLVYSVAYSLEDQIAVLPAVELIDHMKAVDIEHYRVHRHIVVERIQPLAVLYEELLVEQSRERVPLGLMYDHAVLGQLDGTPHPGPYDLGHLVGLRDKVGRSQLKALNLRFLFGGEHYHGYAAQFPVRPYDLQKAVAVHLGHMQIKNDKTYRLVLSHDLQRLHTVLGVFDLVEILQHVPQHLPLDHLIVHDEYRPVQSFFSLQKLVHILPPGTYLFGS